MLGSRRYLCLLGIPVNLGFGILAVGIFSTVGALVYGACHILCALRGFCPSWLQSVGVWWQGVGALARFHVKRLIRCEACPVGLLLLLFNPVMLLMCSRMSGVLRAYFRAQRKPVTHWSHHKQINVGCIYYTSRCADIQS